MAIISPVSDLRNYNTVLEQVSAGSPVYLTVNGRGRFTIRDIADDEEFEKAKAMLRLMCELNTGIRSGEEEVVHPIRTIIFVGCNAWFISLLTEVC